jgi:hypothetical protein
MRIIYLSPRQQEDGDEEYDGNFNGLILGHAEGTIGVFEPVIVMVEWKQATEIKAKEECQKHAGAFGNIITEKSIDGKRTFCHRGHFFTTGFPHAMNSGHS